MSPYNVPVPHATGSSVVLPSDLTRRLPADPWSGSNYEEIDFFYGNSIRNDMEQPQERASTSTAQDDLQPVSCVTTVKTSVPSASMESNGNATILHRGAVLASPDNDRSVHTAFGTVQIASSALVLVVAMPNGTAVYDMHDSSSNDVSVEVAGHNTYLTPGKHVLISNSSVSSYEQINPLECIGHRDLRMANLEGGLRQFSSEFSLPSALNGLKLLTQIKHSANAHDRKIVQQAMKNAAIIMQTKVSSGAYQRMGSPRTFTAALSIP